MIQSFVKLMKALSDPNRVLILEMLQQKMMCVSEIRAALQIAQPTVSKHLKILLDAGLVTAQKDGLWMNYRPSSRNSSPYVDSILGSMRYWLEDDPRVAGIMEKLPAIRRENLNKDGHLTFKEYENSRSGGERSTQRVTDSGN